MRSAIVIDRRVNGQAVLPAQIVVVQAVAGRDVDKTRAGVARDKIGREQFSRAIAKWVLVLSRCQLFNREGRFRVTSPAAFLRHGGQQAAK